MAASIYETLIAELRTIQPNGWTSVDALAAPHGKTPKEVRALLAQVKGVKYDKQGEFGEHFMLTDESRIPQALVSPDRMRPTRLRPPFAGFGMRKGRSAR